MLRLITKRIRFLVFNFLGLQLTWAACAYGATHAFPLLGFYVGIIYVALHFIFSQQRSADFFIMLIVSILGIIIDALNSIFNIVAFSSYVLPIINIPPWLITLWLVFALVLPHSLFWLAKYRLISIIAGAIGGALSYWTGHKLGAIIFPSELISTLVYALEWALIVPVAFMITQHFVIKKTQVI